MSCYFSYNPTTQTVTETIPNLVLSNVYNSSNPSNPPLLLSLQTTGNVNANPCTSAGTLSALVLDGIWKTILTGTQSNIVWLTVSLVNNSGVTLYGFINLALVSSPAPTMWNIASSWLCTPVGNLMQYAVDTNLVLNIQPDANNNIQAELTGTAAPAATTLQGSYLMMGNPTVSVSENTPVMIPQATLTTNSSSSFEASSPVNFVPDSPPSILPPIFEDYR